MKYAFIEANRREHQVTKLCRILKVARSGSYAWTHKPQSDRAIEDGRLLPLIRASYAASSGIYGSPRIFEDLREVGETCGKNRIARIMRENKIRALYEYKRPQPLTGDHRCFLQIDLSKSLL